MGFVVACILFAYREAIHEATGFSLFELVFGRQVRGPLDVVRDQWEGTEVLPVSIAEYLDDLYQKMEEMSELAGRKDQPRCVQEVVQPEGS